MSKDTESEEDLEDLKSRGWKNAESYAFAKAMDAAWLRAQNMDFADAVREFRSVEAEFVARAGGDEYEVLEIKRRVVEAILKEAVWEEPFEVCQSLWNDLLRLGFSDIERKCSMSCIYADYGCRRSHRPAEGVAVLEPVIADLEALLAQPGSTAQAVKYCHNQLDDIRTRIEKLRAQQAEAKASD